MSQSDDFKASSSAAAGFAALMRLQKQRLEQDKGGVSVRQAQELKNAGLAVSVRDSESKAQAIAGQLRSVQRQETVLQADPWQAQAVDFALRHRISILSGAAGTGKTTTEKNIVKAFQEAGRADPSTFAACAFTAKAKNVTASMLPDELKSRCFTIHALLEATIEVVEELDKKTGLIRRVRRSFFKRDAANPLRLKLLFIDEASMVSLSLGASLFEALPADCTVVIVGDINQLPPVGGDSVLAAALCRFPECTTILQTVYRQGENSAIIGVAHKILEHRRGQAVVPLNSSRNRGENSGDYETRMLNDWAGNTSQVQFKAFDFDQRGQVNDLSYHWRQFKAIVVTLTNRGWFDPFLDQIILPGSVVQKENSQTFSAFQLNCDLGGHFNKLIVSRDAEKNRADILNEPQTVYGFGGARPLTLFDQVRCTVNNKDLGIYNGMTGQLVAIRHNPAFAQRAASANRSVIDMVAHVDDLENYFADRANLAMSDNEIARLEAEAKKMAEQSDQRQLASHILTIAWDDGVTREIGDFSSVGSIWRNYALSCHASQGSEFRNIIIGLSPHEAFHIHKNWIYTAITRAREKVLFVTSVKALNQALNNEYLAGRTLQHKIDNFTLKMRQDKDKQAALQSFPWGGWNVKR